MNTTEAVLLLRKVRAYRPAMILDEFTGDAWAEALHDIRHEDAALAVRNIAQRTSDWIDPALIRTEVRKIRQERCAKATPPIPPAGLTQVEERRWLAEAWRMIADGNPAPTGTRGELKPRNLTAITGGAA